MPWVVRCPRSSCKQEVEPVGFSLGCCLSHVTHGGQGLGQLHRVMASSRWVPAGRAESPGSACCLPCCLHYLWVAVTQSPTNVTWPTSGQGREKLFVSCVESALFPCRLGGWGGLEPRSWLKALNCLSGGFLCCWTEVLSPLEKALAAWLLQAF